MNRAFWTALLFALVVSILGACATPSHLESGASAPAPYGFYDYCGRERQDPVCKTYLHEYDQETTK